MANLLNILNIIFIVHEGCTCSCITFTVKNKRYCILKIVYEMKMFSVFKDISLLDNQTVLSLLPF